LNLAKKIVTAGGIVLLSFIALHVLGDEAFAAENADNWRPIFDLVMRWVNFVILAFLLIKFSRTPIKDFFKSRRKELTSEIKALEKEKQDALREVDENLKLLEESGTRFEKLKERIAAQGEKNKANIINAARQESEILLEAAKRKIDYQLVEARYKLKLEMIDAAIDIAMKRLPKEVTAEDNQKWIDKFLSGANAK
jgi:F-type H+-transporting ATPase subunit b